MSRSNHYNDTFFSIQKDTSYESALHIVPYLIGLFNPKSVLDIGCGLGTWLKVFDDHGIPDVQGIDGNHINREDLFIKANQFSSTDISKHFDLGRKFDILISLEVGEHISHDCADIFLDNLARHSDVIFFSAAIPFQGGTNHINEQWQSYWADKFVTRGYTPLDSVRRKFWNFPSGKIQTHYVQNSLLYVHSKVVDTIAMLDDELVKSRNCIYSVVHPLTFAGKSDYKVQDVQTQMRHFFKLLKYRLLKK